MSGAGRAGAAPAFSEASSERLSGTSRSGTCIALLIAFAAVGPRLYAVCPDFVLVVNYPAGVTPQSVAARDLNADGRLDLAVASSGSNNISILLANVDRTFAAAVNYTVGTSPMSVVLADLSGDAKPDLAVANSGSNNLS